MPSSTTDVAMMISGHFWSFLENTFINLMGHVLSVTCHFPLIIFSIIFIQRSVKDDHLKNLFAKRV